jgi:hypothetical protein
MFLEKNYIIMNSLMGNEENYNIMYFINKCLKLNIPLNKAIIYSKYYENYKNINCGYNKEIMNLILKIENI